MRDDRQLIREIQESSITAFEQLYDRYSARAWRVALSVCGDERPAEDAVEGAFVSIWTTCRSYRADQGTVAAWILTNVRNRAVAIVHSEEANRDSRSAMVAAESRRTSVQVGAQADEAPRQTEALRLLQELPDAQQEVITLALYGELTHSEIATCLELSAETVNGRMRLGLHELIARSEQPTSVQSPRSRTQPIVEREANGNGTDEPHRAWRRLRSVTSFAGRSAFRDVI